MKKLLTLLVLTTPFTTYAQASASGDVPGIFSLLLGIGILILVFLAFRSIMLWYWKVDSIIKNQEKLNELLEELAKKQDKHNNYMENNIYSIKEHLTK